MKTFFLDIRSRLLSESSRNYKYVQENSASGVNDAKFSGVYTGFSVADIVHALLDTFTVTISANGTPDKFNWTSARASGTNVNITAGVQVLTEGISVKFNATTGHAIDDKWTFKITSDPLVMFCQMWNDQTKEDEAGDIYSFPKPAVFIEIVSPSPIEQLGKGFQIYSDLVVKLHIVHVFLNATDGNGMMEQDLTILDLKQSVYKIMQLYKPTGAVEMVRVSETQQYNHKNIYEFIQEYKTNLVDGVTESPREMIIKPPPTTYEASFSKQT